VGGEAEAAAYFESASSLQVALDQLREAEFDLCGSFPFSPARFEDDEFDDEEDQDDESLGGWLTVEFTAHYGRQRCWRQVFELLAHFVGQLEQIRLQAQLALHLTPHHHRHILTGIQRRRRPQHPPMRLRIMLGQARHPIPATQHLQHRSQVQGSIASAITRRYSRSKSPASSGRSTARITRGVSRPATSAQGRRPLRTCPTVPSLVQDGTASEGQGQHGPSSPPSVGSGTL
jgi:hypothetical protein